MAAIPLGVTFDEESSGAPEFSFTGFDNVSVTPNSFSWTLTDPDKNIINGREDVSETPALTIFVLLQGDDLALPGVSNARFLTIKGTFNSILGVTVVNNVPYTKEFSFDINRILNIPPN